MTYKDEMALHVGAANLHPDRVTFGVAEKYSGQGYSPREAARRLAGEIFEGQRAEGQRRADAEWAARAAINMMDDGR